MKTKLQWTEDLAVNIDDLDRHHKNLFNIIKKMVTLKDQDSGEKEMLELIKEIIDYSGYHFSKEHNVMVDYEYPGLNTHINEHHQYTQKMLSFLEDFKNKKQNLLNDILKYLSEWWLSHIAKEDMGYAKYIHNLKDSKMNDSE